MTLQEQILKRIRIERVTPTSKGFFKTREYAVWTILGGLFAALSVGSCMIIFMLEDTDRSVFARLGLSFSEKLAYSVPVFWIATTLVIAGAAYFNLKRTRKGYRISGRQFAVVAVIVAVGFGSVLYSFKVAKYLDHAAANIPLYKIMVPLDTETWFDPSHGLLSGAVKIKTSNGNFTLRDENFDLWTVTGTDVIMMPNSFTFQSGDHIKIIGKKTGDLQFQAMEIRPFEIETEKQPRTQ